MAESYNPDQSIGFVLNDVARLLRRNFNRCVQDLGLTQSQWQAIAHIARKEGMKQSELADILEVQPISVARLIDRMEAAGWVVRRPDPVDRRAINLYLTDKCDPILNKMKKTAMEVSSRGDDFPAAWSCQMLTARTGMKMANNRPTSFRWVCSARFELSALRNDSPTDASPRAMGAAGLR